MAHDILKNRLQLLAADDLGDKLQRIRALMAQTGMDSMLIGDNTNIFYLTGRVFDGFIYLSPDGSTSYLVRRPTILRDDALIPMRKPEDIPTLLAERGIMPPKHLGLELSQCSYATVMRLAKAMGVSDFLDADAVLLQARSVKTAAEQAMIARCGILHQEVYHAIPHLYREGMSDVELQIEIERITRQKGALGIMRFTGQSLELNMGSVLAGQNADSPAPYDFALGGAGTSPALPIGADGTILHPGITVMVDTNGCFNGYMTDMTRTYAIGTVPDVAVEAHRLSIAICRRLEQLARPGAKCSDLYNEALAMVHDARMADYFMGHVSQAGFVGHGVGITVNELPVLAPRSRAVLQAGNVIALEPKFVIPHVGAVGIENTYAVTADGPLHCFTNAPEDLADLS